MVKLSRPLDEQLDDIERNFERVIILSREPNVEIFWAALIAGNVFSITIECNTSWLLSEFENYTSSTQNYVQCRVFYTELLLLSDLEFYHIPHTWLPHVLSRADQIKHMIRDGYPPPLMKRGEMVICPYDHDYLHRNGVDFFEIMKLVASYLHMHELWRSGYGWRGEGRPHRRNFADEALLRKALRRHHFSSSSAAALGR